MSASIKKRTVSIDSVGIRKSVLIRVGRMDTVELFTPTGVGTGMVDGINRSPSPAGFRSKTKSLLKYPPIFINVVVPGIRLGVRKRTAALRQLSNSRACDNSHT